MPPANYAMNPAITANSAYSAQMVADLESLPTMSLVSTTPDWFGPDGIYANTDDRNKSFEAPGSMEYFNPATPSAASYTGIVDFQMYGGVGREADWNNVYLGKHSISVMFDQANGPSSMDFNLFGNGYHADRLILRHGFNDGWGYGGSNTQFIIDQWTRDTLAALGTHNSDGVWVQLFINGLYWGLYNACDHIDNNFAAYFYGGDPADYDILHVGSGWTDVSGVTTAWSAMFNLATTGNTAGTGGYNAGALAATGPGTPYALMATYLNLPAFCDYLITNFYGGNWDWDGHNWSAIYAPPSAGFAGTPYVFLDWDGEGMLQNPRATFSA